MFHQVMLYNNKNVKIDDLFLKKSRTRGNQEYNFELSREIDSFSIGFASIWEIIIRGAGKTNEGKSILSIPNSLRAA